MEFQCISLGIKGYYLGCELSANVFLEYTIAVKSNYAGPKCWEFWVGFSQFSDGRLIIIIIIIIIIMIIIIIIIIIIMIIIIIIIIIIININDQKM